MDYSKSAVNKKLRQLKTTTTRLSTKVKVSSFRLFLVCIVFLAVTGAMAAFGTLEGLISSAPDINNINVVPTGYTTKFYYSDGTLSQTLVGAGSNREYVTIDEIPIHVQNAFIAIEDERFREHDGIDVRSIFRAAVEMLTSGDLQSGASTITQQLLKNQIFGGGNESSDFDKIIRKLQEQYLAIQLENTLDKNTILEYYLNTINLGQGAYGIQMASRTYFGKDVGELTISEAAVLACLPKSPTNMNPLTNPEENMERRDTVLYMMDKLGFITEEEYQTALNDTESVYLRIASHVEENSEVSYYSYFTDEVINQLMNDLQTELGYSASQASSMIYTSGLRVFTTQDRQIQDICDEVVARPDMYPEIGKGSYYDVSYALSVLKEDGTTIHYQLADFIKHHNSFKNSSSVIVRISNGLYNLLCTDLDYLTQCIDEFRTAHVAEGDTILGERFIPTLQPQISLSIMDQSNGAVVALVGGRGEKTGNRTLNRATSTIRQVGSTYKVLAAFLPALDTGGMTLATPIDDAPFFYPGSTKEVQNWYKRNPPFLGLSTLRYGLSYSMNIVAVKTLQAVTPPVGFDYLKKLGFTTLVDYQVAADGSIYTDIGLPLALGGLTNGVSNIEMTAAFASIANGGVYNEPYYYTKVLDHEGNVLLEHEPSSRQVMKTSTAYLLTNAMQDTFKASRGTTTQPVFVDYEMPIAGKTGTTTNSVDLWLCAYSPYYTCSIWSGFDNNYEVTNSKHNYIWRDIMEAVHREKQLAYKDFAMPDSILTASICTKSGLLAKPGVCDAYEAGSTVRTEYFAKGTVPTEYCDCHVIATICLDTGHLATEYCTNVEEKVLLVKDEPVIYIPTETDPTMATPTPVPEGYVIPKNEEIKKEYHYITSDTKYILPSEYCTVHTFVEVLPPEQTGPFDPSEPGTGDTGEEPDQSGSPQPPYVPAVPTPTPLPDTTNPFSNGGFQSH
ncbi:MAG: transglycosylase domain-containing protein [Lachnospiraceae bacterium]|nr:transglycosylase domain-containing protein [Lachnospiraceae bacterium]MBP3610974.1 transglycosylase domain-containing protein [Lachnospiraceae bacterium]